MIHLLGVAMVVGSCGTLGFVARERLRNRVRTLDALLVAMAHIRAEIAQALTPLPDILQQLAEGNNPVQAQVFTEICTRMAQENGLSLGFHWNSTFRDLAHALDLQEEEVEVLRNASNFLGRYAPEEQLRNIDHAVLRLEACRRQACEVLHQRGSIYRTCGIAAGIVAVLVLA